MIERSRVLKRHAHLGFLTLRTEKGVYQCAQAIKRGFAVILQDIAQHLGGLFLFVGLESKEDRRLVRKVLIDRSNADTCHISYPRRGETRRALLGENLLGRLQDRRHQLRRTGLFRLLSRANLRLTSVDHGGMGTKRSLSEEETVDQPH